MKLALFGPPGAGKGTQSKLIYESYGIPSVSTGDVLREMTGERIADGRTVGEVMASGDLLPDNDMIRILGIHPVIASGHYQLDGFPRTLAQAELQEREAPLDLVVHLDLPYEECARRLAARADCKPCGINYGLDRMPDTPGYCDSCRGELSVRPDDVDPGIVEIRLGTYDRKTRPLLNYFDSRHKLYVVGINPSWSPERIFDDVVKPFDVLFNLQPSGPREIAPKTRGL